MKKILAGAIIGAALGYVVRKLQDDGAFDGLCDNLSACSAKAKRNVKNTIDAGRNQAEYLAERASDVIEKGKSKFNEALEK